ASSRSDLEAEGAGMIAAASVTLLAARNLRGGWRRRRPGHGRVSDSWKVAIAALALAGMSVATAPVFAETGRSVLVVLDASGSMNAQLPEGRTRLEAAKAAVGDLVGSLAPDTRLALRVYRHQSTTDQKNCQDSELVAGFAPVSEGRAALVDKV